MPFITETTGDGFEVGLQVRPNTASLLYFRCENILEDS